VNGTAVATNTAMTLNPSSLPATTQDYIGKSQFPPDPVLNATVDEVQIYDRALSAAEVQSLTTSAGGSAGGGNVAWYRFDEAKGDVAVDSSGHGRNGTIVPVTTDWTLVQDGGGSVAASLDSGTPLNDQLDRSLSLHLVVGSAGAGQRVGMANDGYFGVPVVPGRTYRVSFFAKVLPVTASASGLYYSATIDSRSGQVYLKIVNPGSQDVPGQLSFYGRNTSAASIEVLADPDPQAGDTLANPGAVVPARSTLHGSKGVFSYLVPANSLTVVRVAR